MADPIRKVTKKSLKSLKKIQEECSNDSILTAKKLIELGCTLRQAVTLKDASITEYMLDNGYNVNERNNIQSTPLHKAVEAVDFENTKLLINRGADINAETIHWRTPLSFAKDCTEKHLEILKFLLCHGAEPTVDSLFGLFNESKEETIEMLLQYNDDFITKTHISFNLLHAISVNENVDPRRILKGKHLDINATSEDGRTALMIAAYSGNISLVDYLLSLGAQVNAVDSSGFTVLSETIVSHWRRQKNTLEIIELVLQHGADPQGTNYDQIFEVVLRDEKYTLIEPYLAQLALNEDLGVKIKENLFAKINSHGVFKKYFNLCKRKIEKMKITVIYDSVTLYKFLTVDEQKMIKYTRNEESIARLKAIMHSKRHSKMYYSNVLKRRVQKAMRIVNLRRHAFDVLARLCKLENNTLVIENILDYLNVDDFETMTRVL